jgi:hypothetical protein
MFLPRKDDSVMQPWLIYLIGIVPFGFFYYALKQRLGTVLFVVLAVIYLVCLRQLAIYLARKLNRAEDSSDVQT